VAVPAKTLFSIACLLFFPAALAADPPKIIRSGWYPWDPYQYTVVKHDMKQLTGLDVQLVRAAFQRLGYEVVCDEVTVFSFGEAMNPSPKGPRRSGVFAR
jgi:hypothetical protein